MFTPVFTDPKIVLKMSVVGNADLCVLWTRELEGNLEITITRLRVEIPRLVPCTQYPCECCPFIKTFSYICRSGGLRRPALHIVKVFFRKSSTENVVVLNSKGRY